MKKLSIINGSILIILIIIATSTYFVISKKKQEQFYALMQYKKVAQKVVHDSWNHYKNNENFKGDWWAGRFVHPKMILDNGCPLAFPDGSDVDMDGLSDIDWGNPTKPYEYTVVSEGASYVMLRAVWMRDKQTFDKVWKWTHDNLQRANVKYIYYWKDVNNPENAWKTPEELNLDRDNLFSWRWLPTIATRDGKSQDGVIYYKWQPPTKEHNPNDPWRDGWDNATDADADIALALVFADSLWGSAEKDSYNNYSEHARGILNDLWDKCTVIGGGVRYIDGGNNVKSLEPGYLSPFSYRIFDDFDPKHDWMQLVDSSYRIFRDSPRFPMNPIADKLGKMHLNDPRTKKPAPNLIPDWINVEQDGSLADGSPRNEPEFGTDSFRALWRISVDYLWNKPDQAKEVLFASGQSSPIKFFKWRMKNPPKDIPDQKYDLNGKLSSVFWHNGDVPWFEPNYEPPADIPNRKDRSNCFRANCANYGVYLSYLYAAEEFDFAKQFLMPLINEEQDGFSKRQYIIPEDQLKQETPEHLAMNTPLEKRDSTHDNGIPYSNERGDGWWIKSQWGGYWTQWDHSDWNSQNEYFNNMWTWFGLATYAGVVQNLYKDQQREPKTIQSIKVYEDEALTKEQKGPINSEFVYVVVKGKDANRRHQDYVKVKISANDPIKENYPITLKLTETARNTGVFVAKLRVGMESNKALDQIGASRGSDIDIIVEGSKKHQIKRTVGDLYISMTLEDYSNGSIDDANPTSWWTDSYFPSCPSDISNESKKFGYYIWVDASDTWHIVMKTTTNNMHTFQGQIYSDGDFTDVKNINLEKGDSVIGQGKSISFSCIDKSGMDSFSFKCKGSYIKLDVKLDGLYEPKRVFVGAPLSAAYGMPFVLKTKGETGTYLLTPTKEKLGSSKYSMKVEKKYSGKDYPYFGMVLFDKEAKDWSGKDEFSISLYLKEDVGNIRVDIQDSAGNIAILNGYNPWDPNKGEGWYVWRSNTLKGTEVNRDNVEPRAIKDRKFWKGWSFDQNKTVEVSNKLNLHDIVNVQVCVGPAENKDCTLYIDKVYLETSNYYKGKSDPKNIKYLALYKDKEFHIPFSKGETIKQNRVYVELIGRDGSPYTADTILVKIDSSDKHPRSRGIKIPLEETSANSGVYRGELKIGIQSSEKLGLVGASRGSIIQLYSRINKFKNIKYEIGDFQIETVVEDFETTLSKQAPASWWTDDLDPLRGEPEYAAGRKLGYFLWKTKDDIWHLRWSGDLRSHLFYGKITANNNIKILQRINFEKGDSAETKKNIIIINGNEAIGDDGIDFIATGDEVWFDLSIDNIYYGNKFQIGKFEYKKAYSIPFMLKNTDITSTYALLTTDTNKYDGENSLFISKKYNKKDYPYIGKWGLDGEKANFSLQDSLKFMVYLPKDIGNIRVDIEDTSGNSAIVNEYNPWDESKGRGWYEWDSNFSYGIGVSEKKIQPLPIKDRTWFRGWHLVKQENIDVSKKINLAHIINLLLSIGGGDKKDVHLNIDNIKLYRANYHLGSAKPKKITAINLYSDQNYLKEKIIENQKVNKKNIYVELCGVDGNPFERDRFYIDILTGDKYKNCIPIKLRVYETKADSGIYRGKFTIDLSSSEAQETIGAASGKKITVVSPLGDRSFSFIVGDMQNSYIIDDFEDGSISDKNPVTWWIDTIDPVAKKVLIDPVYDKGVYIYRDIDDVWHVIWNPEDKDEQISGYIGFDNKLKLLDKKDFKKGITIDKDKKQLLFDMKAKNNLVKQLSFKMDGNNLTLYFKSSGVEAKDKVFIGQDKKSPFMLPIKISNLPVINNYDLSVLTDKVKDTACSLQIKKNYTGNSYPYFGCWGLAGDVSDFSDKDSLSFWVYLFADPGNIRVDIQDANGITAVLNGYNPYDYQKGPGWYLWTSGFTGGFDVDEGKAQPLPIKDRKWWQGWDLELQKYVDVSDKLDLRKIKNVQFAIGGGDKRSVTIVIDNLRIDKANVHFGNTPPANINAITFYKTKSYTDPYSRNDEMKQNHVFFKIFGGDGDPLSLDKYKISVFSDDPRADAYPIDIMVQETGTNTGVYTGKFNLGLKSDNKTDTLGIEKGRLVKIAYGNGKVESIKVGEIVQQYLIDDFSDGKVSDKNPVTWWVDSVNPVSDKSIVNSNSKPGYYIWKEKNIWHVRWLGSKKGDKFEGTISTKGTIKNLSKVKLDFFDKIRSDGKTITILSKNKSKVVGIDFFADSDYVEFDIRQNDEYQGRNIWIGANGSLAYSVPFRIDNNKISSTYRLSVEKSTRKSEGSMMKVDKRYSNKDYPYFGCWGLRGDVGNWTDINEFYMWLYLPGDVGSIKVELEDNKGQKGILNGYSPYDPKKGPGWYKWTSNFFDSPEVKDENIHPLPIKNRKWWKSWSDNEQAFIDNTENFDLSNIKNVEFVVGGGETRNVVLYVDSIVLEKTNYRLGDAYPSIIKTITIYKDKSYLYKYKKNEAISKKDVFIELVGQDGNKDAVDIIDVVINITHKGKEISRYLHLLESSADSGIYRGKMRVSTGPQLETDEWLVNKGDVLTIKTLGSDLKTSSIKIGNINKGSSKFNVLKMLSFIGVMMIIIVYYKVRPSRNVRDIKL
ncbi:MAG TPA: hypothetical protein DCS13_13850 [Candidatus Margulisbacteria bacterium]|nr:MAG: hypothetical protein A2X43_04040 [Candidatus Margulisbacteria bacterium GWD2_39_127]HAR64542.1 hypothetical protein [Candidatus Margulisiibacteriota bacterium]